MRVSQLLQYGAHRNLVMNKIASIFVILVMLGMFIMSGCQSSPERQAVVSKQNNTAALYETQADEEITPRRFRHTEEFTSTDDSVRFYLNIDQELQTQKMPVVEVIPRSITSEDAERVAKALLGDVAFYEREPSSDPQYSKSQYQEMIARLVPYSNLTAMSDLVGVDQAQSMLGSFKQGIDQLTKAMENAPEENPHIPCDWMFKKERHYNDSDFDIGNRALGEDDDWLVATAKKGGMGYTYMVICRNQPDYKLNRFNIQLGGASVHTSWDRQIYWSELCRTGAPTQQQLQSVQLLVTNVLENMDLGQWRITETQIETFDMGNEPEYLLRIHATPVLHGVPVVYGQKNTQQSDDYAGAYALTQATFLMSSNGDLLDMELDSPLQVKSIINENVATLPFSQLIDRARNHLTLSDAGNFGLPLEQLTMYEQHFDEKILCYVTMDQAEYGLARIMAEDTTDRYYYVPALMLHGSIEYCGENSNKVYFNTQDNYTLCINATDGTIIS